MTVYVAGSSDELDRARRVMDRYRAAGVEVVSTWVERVTAAGEGNPRGWSREQRAACAYPCIDEVRAADVLHWLAPSVGHGRGSYWEAALAWVWSKQIIASGDTKQSIFPALVRETVTDEAAILEVIGMHARAGKLRKLPPPSTDLLAIDAWSSTIGRSPHAHEHPRVDGDYVRPAPVTLKARGPFTTPGTLPPAEPCERYIGVGFYCGRCAWQRADHPAPEVDPLVLDHAAFLGRPCYCPQCAGTCTHCGTGLPITERAAGETLCGPCRRDGNRPAVEGVDFHVYGAELTDVRGLPGEPSDFQAVDPLEDTGVEDSAPLAVEHERSRAIGKPIPTLLPGEGE